MGPRPWRQFTIDVRALTRALSDRMAEHDDFVRLGDGDERLTFLARWNSTDVRGFLGLWLSSAVLEILEEGPGEQAAPPRRD